MRNGQSNRGHSRPARYSVALLRVLLWLVLGIGWLWAALAILFFNPLPAWVRVPAVIAWGAATVWCGVRLGRRRAWRVIAAGVLGVWLIWSLQRPSNDRTWMPDQARLPVATFQGDSVTIENLRYATYQSTDDYDVRWCRRKYDLNALDHVDFVVEPFASWRGPAHTLLTFGFADGEHVAVSVEIRKEQGESFSAVKGIFRQYELMYVIGDERDLIGLRFHTRKNPVYLYPIKATKEQVRALFVAMLQRANRLAEEPEFYNTVTSSCTTNIVRHMEDLTGEDLPLDWRVFLPGYSDELAFDLGLIDYQGSLEEARRRFCVSNDVAPEADGRVWSRKIRQCGR